MQEKNNISQTENLSKKLPVMKLIPLTLAGFIAIMTETMPAGLLLEISRSLGIKESLAGQWITLYALGSVLAAIPIIAVTLHWSRKRLLLLAITGFFIFNAITALSSSYILTLVARFIAGMAAGVTWGLLIGYSKRMVSEDIQGRAIAMVGLGQPIALAAGVPLAVWLGKIFGWNGAFAIMSVISFLLIIWIATSLPDIKGVKPEKKVSVYRIFMLNGIRQLLLIMFLWILAHNILYTYISPFLSNFGLSHKVDLLLLIFGLASLSGIIITGFLIDKNLAALTKGGTLMFGMGILLMIAASYWPSLLYLGIIFWGISFGGIPTLLQKAVADKAGEYSDIAQSMFVTIFNLAVALGGFMGGILLDRLGAGAFPYSMLILTVIVMLLLSNKVLFTAEKK